MHEIAHPLVGRNGGLGPKPALVDFDPIGIDRRDRLPDDVRDENLRRRIVAVLGAREQRLEQRTRFVEIDDLERDLAHRKAS